MKRLLFRLMWLVWEQLMAGRRLPVVCRPRPAFRLPPAVSLSGSRPTPTASAIWSPPSFSSFTSLLRSFPISPRRPFRPPSQSLSFSFSPSTTSLHHYLSPATPLSPPRSFSRLPAQSKVTADLRHPACHPQLSWIMHQPRRRDSVFYRWEQPE